MKIKKRDSHECCVFGERYFPHYLTTKTGAFHHELMRLADDGEQDRIDILAPRGHAKSTWVSIIYPIWRIVKNRDINILIVSDTQEQSEVFLKAIKHELETNERLIQDFGAFKPTEKGNTTVWRANDITVVRNTASKEPTIFCGGVGKRILGRRADLILVDDPLNEENVESELQREKTNTWFMKTLAPIVKRDGRIVVLGTKKHRNDLHGFLKGTGMYACYTYRAIGADGKALWPEEWNLGSLLRKKKEIGERIFDLEYQNTIPAEGGNEIHEMEMEERVWEKGEKFEKVIRGCDLPILFSENGRMSIKRKSMAVMKMGFRGEERHLLEYTESEEKTITGMNNIIESESGERAADAIVMKQDIKDCLNYFGLINREKTIRGHWEGLRGETSYGLPNIMINMEKKRYVNRMDGEMAKLAERRMREGEFDMENSFFFTIWMCEQGMMQEKEVMEKIEVIDAPW